MPRPRYCKVKRVRPVREDRDHLPLHRDLGHTLIYFVVGAKNLPVSRLFCVSAIQYMLSTLDQRVPES